MILPCHCYGIAMLLPCYCMLLHVIAVSLPCYCHVIVTVVAISWQYHGNNMAIPWQYHRVHQCICCDTPTTRTLDVDRSLHDIDTMCPPHPYSARVIYAPSSIPFPLRCVRGGMDYYAPRAISSPFCKGRKSRLQPTSRLRPLVQSFSPL